MKKFLKFLLKIVGRTVIVAVSIYVPALFSVVLFFALKQTFAIGLVMLLTSLVIQFLVSRKDEHQFGWSQYRYLYDINDDVSEILEKIQNILFNLVKVASALGTFLLVYLNFSSQLNPLGKLGIVIFISLMIIFMVLLSFVEHKKNYEVLRRSLGLIVLLATIGFTYMTFGTQLVWIPFLVSVIFGELHGFEEIEDALSKKDLEDGFGSFLFSITLLLASIISTIIQFWSYIANVIISIWNFLVKVGTYELIIGKPVWVIVLILVSLAAIIYPAVFFTNKAYEKRECQKMEKEKAVKAAEEKKAKELKDAKDKEAERVASEKKWQEINDLAGVLKGRFANIDELTFIAVTSVKFNCLHKFSIKHLAGVYLNGYFTISKIKKQIVWDPTLTHVLNLYAYLYERNYEDDNLESISYVLDKLATYLSDYKEYVGYKEIKEQIQKTKIPVNWK